MPPQEVGVQSHLLNKRADGGAPYSIPDYSRLFQTVPDYWHGLE